MRVDDKGRPELGNRTGWIVEYKCGCSVGPTHFKNLLGYCAVHGDGVLVRYRIPPKRRRKM